MYQIQARNLFTDNCSDQTEDTKATYELFIVNEINPYQFLNKDVWI